MNYFKTISNNIENVKLKFDSDLTEIANHFHSEVISPICEKYNLKFHSGMGTFFFEDLSTGKNINEDDVERILFDFDRDYDDGDKPNYKMYEELDYVFNIITIEIYNNLFAHYIQK